MLVGRRRDGSLVESGRRAGGRGPTMKRSTDLERLTICDQPTTEEIAFLEKSLHEYDEEQTHGRIDAPGLEFELALKDPEGNVVGGISVSSQLGVMFLEVLWIADEHRKRGLGRRLVLAAEHIAEKGGCIAAGTWTFSWQGPQFYPRCGYKLVGIYTGYPFGITEHVLMKRLPDPDDSGRRSEEDGFALVEHPSADDMRVVYSAFHEFCVRNAREEMDYPGIKVQSALRDSGGQIVGGLLAMTTIRIMAFESLWVDARYRGQGYGRQLVIEAERIAKAHGCVAVQGTCFSFQAPGFFRKLGYETFGTTDLFLDGHAQDYLIKKL